MSRAFSVFLVLSTAVSCGTEDPHSRQNTAVADNAQTAPRQMSPHNQYQLARELARAERAARSRDAKTDVLASLRSEWLGNRYRWQVRFVPPLCRLPERCNVAAFDESDPAAKELVQGWMPRLEISESQLAQLQAYCSSREACAFVFEGTLTQFSLSSDLPTSLAFSDVELVLATRETD